jgi:hypothetical protein
MKGFTKWFLLLLVTVSLLVSSPLMQKTEGRARQAALCERLKPCQLLTPAAAEKILGQPVRPTRDGSELKGEVRQCSCAYTAIAKDPASGQDINLYFSFEQKENSPSAEQAQRLMAWTKNENAHDSVIDDLSGIGDEAFRLGDSPNVYFIMVRKGAVVIRLQVKQATDKASLDELKTFAREIAKRL